MYAWTVYGYEPSEDLKTQNLVLDLKRFKLTFYLTVFFQFLLRKKNKSLKMHLPSQTTKLCKICLKIKLKKIKK